MRWTTIVIGALGLALLENVLSHPQAYGRISDLLSGLDAAESRFLSPTAPLFGPWSSGAPSMWSVAGASAGPSPPAPVSAAQQAANRDIHYLNGAGQPGVG